MSSVPRALSEEDEEGDALMLSARQRSSKRKERRTLKLGPLTGIVLDLQALLQRYSSLESYRKQFCRDFETRDIEELRRIYLALNGFNNSYRNFFRDVADVPPYSKSVLCKAVWLSSLKLVSTKTISIINRRLVPRAVRAAVGLVVSKLRRLIGVKLPQSLRRRSRVPEAGLENYYIRAIRAEVKQRMTLEQDANGPIGRVLAEASDAACNPVRRGTKKTFNPTLIVREGVCETVPKAEIRSVGQFRAFVINKARKGQVNGIRTPKAIWFIRPNGSLRCSVQEICFAVEAYRNKDDANVELPGIQEANLESVSSGSVSASQLERDRAAAPVGFGGVGTRTRPPPRLNNILLSEEKKYP